MGRNPKGNPVKILLLKSASQKKPSQHRLDMLGEIEILRFEKLDLYKRGAGTGEQCLLFYVVERWRFSNLLVSPINL
ncbi:hypothetical protein [Evansella clarkii]|jgi:hypothetical protein|uniref:hypothetical protein n=1 Tax=Evansella clarkii TaxID=79879 RepID=UPI000B437223|nr:hypothetical protein [Evansella clarkii]